MIGNYAKHAAIWDWSGFDNTEEYEYWCSYARKYGSNILIPMCAIGETGAYMAQHGFDVTAFDITEEMIDEGRKRFGQIENLRLLQADIRDFMFDIPLIDFVFVKDLMHLQTIQDIKRTFLSIKRHMRESGCLVLELGLPAKESSCSPQRIFYPLKQMYAGKKVWKEGDGRYDAESKRHYISQTVYIQDENGIKQFNHSFYLQFYDREVILNALFACGFRVVNEYCSRTFEKWKPEDEFWIIETIKI